MNVSALPSLQSLRTQTSAQSSIVIANTQPITDLLAGTNVLSSSQVDSILIALDGNGLLNGTVDLSGQTPPAPPSAVGIARALSLIAKTWTVTVDPSIFIFGDGGGGFWQLIVDISGNVGTQATVGPATSDVILADGVGGFWKVVVDIAGNRGTTPDAGPATLVPALDDGTGVFWKLIVDATGNLGAQQIVPIAWAPAAETVTWIDTNGTFAGDLSTFRSTADFATVTSLVFGATGNLTSLTGIQELPVLATLNCNTNALTTLDCSGLSSLDTLNCSFNASLTTLTLTGCYLMTILQCQSCTSLTSVGLSGLVNLALINLQSCNLTGNLDLSPCVALGNVDYHNNPLITSVTLTGLTLLEGVEGDHCNVTGTLDLSTCSSMIDMDSSNNALLTVGNIGTSTQWNFVAFFACGLTVASVNDILSKLAANCLLNAGTCNLNGGSNGSPTGGILNADYVALTGAGWTVNIN